VILLDTNVISELVSPRANETVLAYVASLAPKTVFTAAICEAEIRYGLARMADGKKRIELGARIDGFFDAAFPDQVLRFDRLCAAAYGEIRRSREAAGKPITAEDAMIAAIARAYGVEALATRNTRDFDDCGVPLVDPWSR
jgi:predicted nucleic acid-binding protein